MIFVLADDFSGAAEIAGIGFRYGLRSVLLTEPDLAAEADLLVIDSNTRSMSEPDALQKLRIVTGMLKSLPNEFLYKKIDSVLRGHVVAELRMVMRELNIKKTLVAAANPSAGRTITGGHYYINNIPLDKTGFAEDPEYPARSSEISYLLDTDHHQDVFIRDQIDENLAAGITFGRVKNPDDLYRWASCLSDQILPAGSSEFFEAILESRALKSRPPDPLRINDHTGLVLVVLGSAGHHTMDNVARFRSAGYAICNWPGSPGDLMIPDLHHIWTEALDLSFKSGDKVVITPGFPLSPEPDMPLNIARATAEVVKQICLKRNIQHIFIEGGATASHIVRKFGWKMLIPVTQYGTGVVGLRVPGRENLNIIIKPGSYPWPRFE